MQIEVVRALLVPGWAMWRRRRRPLAAATLLVGVVVPLCLVAYVLLGGRNRLALSLDTTFLAVVVVVGVGAIAARVVALVEVWNVSGRPTRLRGVEIVAVGGAVVALFVASFMVAEVARARSSIRPAFERSGVEPLFDAEAPITSPKMPATPEASPPSSSPRNVPASSTVPSASSPSLTNTIVTTPASIVATTTTTTTLPPLPERPDSGVDPELLSDTTTVLLLGGDAGPGRYGLRTDSMMLLTLHRPSGRASLVSIPRDVRRLLFPPGSALESRYPYGFSGQANAVYPVVSSSRPLRDAYAVDGIRPGVVALAQGIGYSLDVTIHDYVLVDMQGFIDLVDAFGGVTVDVPKRIPMPGNVPGAPTQYPDTIGPGLVAMDGSTALGYVRSRKADNDYWRTRRQRELLAALAQQVSLSQVAGSFGEVAGAVGGTLRTSLSPDDLVATLNVIGDEAAIVESIGLVPPMVNVSRPDYQEMAEVVGRVHVALVESGAPGG